MANDLKLIDFSALGDVANNLIDKLASAIGWVVMRDTPERIALTTYIEEIQRSELPPLEKAARISRAKKDIKEYINQYQIVSKAVQSMSHEAKPEEVDNDWIASFMDKARMISDEEVQLLWAKIMARETERPGSCSLRTLETIKNISKNEALLFQKYAKMAVFGRGNICILDGKGKLKNRFTELLLMEECGLLSSSKVSTIPTLKNDEEELLFYDYSVCGFASSKDKACKLNYSSYVFTKAGAELFEVIDIERDPEMLLDELRILSENNPKVTFKAYRFEKIEEESIHYDDTINLLDQNSNKHSSEK